MTSESGIRLRVIDTRLFEDDMDGVVYDEPREEPEDFEDDEELRYWLGNSELKPGLWNEFRNDLGRLRAKLTTPIKRRAAWAASNFLELGISKYCLAYFIVFVLITLYFGTILHETLHIVAAAFTNEIPVGIRLNSMLYSQVGGALGAVTGGFIQTAAMDSGNPGSALIRYTANPFHTAVIGIFPNVVLFMLGFTWLRKGLNEKSAPFFASGLVFTCSNLEIFIPALRTDITSTGYCIANAFSITGDDVGAVTILLAAAVVGSGYVLSVLYDRWQKRLVEKQRELYPYETTKANAAVVCAGGTRELG